MAASSIANGSPRNLPAMRFRRIVGPVAACLESVPVSAANLSRSEVSSRSTSTWWLQPGARLLLSRPSGSCRLAGGDRRARPGRVATARSNVT